MRFSAPNFGEKSGPFLAGAILFLLPSIGMGMVSPFAIRLATATVASVGKTSGTLYALSTLGSILGTMLTTFVLIPNFGAGAILKGLAGVLALVAVATFPFGSGGSAIRGSLAVLRSRRGGHLRPRRFAGRVASRREQVGPRDQHAVPSHLGDRQPSRSEPANSSSIASPKAPSNSASPTAR